MPAAIKRWSPPRLRVVATREREHYLTADWRAKRQRILIRDSYTCAVCRRVIWGPNAHVDHIIPLAEGGSDDESNLQVLCQSDHSKKTMQEQRRTGRL